MPIPVQGFVTDVSTTVGVTAVQLIAAQNSMNGLVIANPSASGGNTLYVNVSGNTAVANAAGTFPVPPGAVLPFTQAAPRNGVSVIASGASTPCTCIWWE